MKKFLSTLFIILLFTLCFSNFTYAAEANSIPKIILVTIDHVGENEIININSSAQSEIQYQVFYTKKDDGVNWTKVNSLNFIESWTSPTVQYNNYKIDISELNLNTSDYRFDIRVKNANTTGIISDKWGSYDSLYRFVSPSNPKLINSSIYTEFSSAIDIATDKIWSVKFNQEIIDINNFKIKILDSLGNITDIKYAIDQNSKTTIKVYPPTSGYKPLETYHLLLSTLNDLPPINLVLEFKVKEKPIVIVPPVVNEALISQLLLKYKSRFNSDIINNPSKYNLQILYTEINRDKANVPSFTSYKYNVDAKRYFYPASSVKLSACILSSR